MNLSEPIAALEIGTSRTVIAMGEPAPNNHVRVTAISDIPSAGVRKGQIVDVPQARYSLASVIKRLADQKGYSVGQACLAISGTHVQTSPTNVQLPVERGVVGGDDIDQAVDASYDPHLPHERTPLELMKIDFGLDDMDHIASPEGMSGHLLKLHSLCIHGSTQRINDARNVARAAKLEIDENNIFFSGVCAATAVLSPQMKREGALVVDLGGGTTSFTVWSEGTLVQAGVVGVGGDHVTQDIRHAFSLTANQADQVKTGSASCLIGPGDALQRITVPASTPGFKAPSISRRALNTVVNARMQELFTIIRTRLDDENRLHGLHAGVVLTGGGALLNNVVPLAASVFGCRAAIGTLVPEIEGLEQEEHPALHATIAGLLLKARETTPSHSVFDSFRNLFGGLFGK
ncbi:MAG: cell division protein FtsA [Kiritimatiellia bacterium]